VIATENEGQPFLKPTTFVYDEDEQAIYIHGALAGRMRTNIEHNPRVSFCVAEMGRLLPGETAMEVGVEYGSVVVFGTIELINDMEQAKEAEKGGADYIGFGPVFLTETKDAGTPKGLDMLREIRREITIPVV
jgi:nitroimidazol reductase NimA-like FMN-containing flavoprotein (pyridoxamine 5'-phosphate oxidase superfamily)